MPHAFEGTTKLLGDRRMERRQSFDVSFIEDRLVPGDVGLGVTLPTVGGVDNPPLWHHRPTILIVEGKILLLGVGLVSEVRTRPPNVADEFPGIRIEQQFVRIEAMAVRGIEGPVDAIPVETTGAEARQEAVPDFVRVLRE
jgi:hypothetical protein